MRSTSLKAWEKVKKSLPQRQRMVAVKIRQRKGTIRDIAKALNVQAHTVSGRFSELRRKKVIKIVGLKYYSGSNQPHDIYQITKKYEKP